MPILACPGCGSRDARAVPRPDGGTPFDAYCPECLHVDCVGVFLAAASAAPPLPPDGLTPEDLAA
jgi:hypothetical protein